MQLGAVQYWGESARRWDLGGLTVSLTRYPSQQLQPRHRHENPTYFFLLGGEFTDTSSQLGTREPRPFDLLFHPSGAWHEGTSGPNGRFGLNLEPSAEWLEQNGLSSNDLGGYRLDRDPLRASELLRLGTCGFLFPDVEAQMLEILIPAVPHPVESPAWFRRLLNLLDATTERNWTLASLARELAVHPVYLARVFRSRYGCSVTEWLRRRRLLQSAEGLMEGKSSSEVAYEAGFADQSHFGRVFRTYFDHTPGLFRSFWSH